MFNKVKALKNRLYITAVTAQNSPDDKGAGLKRIARRVSVVFTMLMMTMMMVAPVLATDNGRLAILGVLNILYLITNALGILFVIVGFVRLIIAYTQEDAPGQQRSSMFIAVGIALLAVKPILSNLNPQNWLTETGGGDTGGAK